MSGSLNSEITDLYLKFKKECSIVCNMLIMLVTVVLNGNVDILNTLKTVYENLNRSNILKNARILNEIKDILMNTEGLLLKFDNLMKNAESLLSKPKKSGYIKRPINATLIFTNLLNRLGALDIAEEMCKTRGCGKRKKMIFARKIGGIIWKELQDEIKRYFILMAQNVNKLHKEAYPEYRLVKSKKKKTNYTVYKPYSHEEKKNRPKRKKTTPSTEEILSSYEKNTEDSLYKQNLCTTQSTSEEAIHFHEAALNESEETRVCNDTFETTSSEVEEAMIDSAYEAINSVHDIFETTTSEVEEAMIDSAYEAINSVHDIFETTTSEVEEAIVDSAYEREHEATNSVHDIFETTSEVAEAVDNVYRHEYYFDSTYLYGTSEAATSKEVTYEQEHEDVEQKYPEFVEHPVPYPYRNRLWPPIDRYDFLDDNQSS